MAALDNYTAMADNERRVDMAGAQNALTPHVVDWGIRNALEFANAYQTPRNLLAALTQAAYNAPGTIAGTAQSFLTGQPGGPQTKDQIYNAAGRSVNALGSAGLVAGPFAGRALQGVAATNKPAAGIKAYHGTNQSFDRFDPSQSRSLGIHFGTQKQANKALNNDLGASMDDARVIPAELNFKKTMRVGDAFGKEPRALLDHLEQRGAKFTAGEKADVSRLQFHDPSAANEVIRKSLVKQGYDGLVYKNRAERDRGMIGQLKDSYVALAPGTVKSATTGKALFSDSRGAAPILDPEIEPDNLAAGAFNPSMGFSQRPGDRESANTSRTDESFGQWSVDNLNQEATLTGWKDYYKVKNYVKGVLAGDYGKMPPHVYKKMASEFRDALNGLTDFDAEKQTKAIREFRADHIDVKRDPRVALARAYGYPRWLIGGAVDLVRAIKILATANADQSMFDFADKKEQQIRSMDDNRMSDAELIKADRYYKRGVGMPTPDISVDDDFENKLSELESDTWDIY